MTSPPAALEALKALSIKGEARSSAGGTRLMPWVVAVLATTAALAVIANGSGRDIVLMAFKTVDPGGKSASTQSPALTSSATAAVATPRDRPAAAIGFSATGYVVARRKSSVSAEISGKVVEVLVDEGEIVAAGKPIARLDDRLARSDVEIASAKLASAVAARDVAVSSQGEARRVLERVQQLSANGHATVAELTRTGAQLVETDARLRQAIADVAAANETLMRTRTTLSLHEVRAPFTGVVALRSVEPGEVVSATSSGATRTSICTLVDLSSLEVEVEINEGTFARVSLGMSAVVTFDGLPNVAVPGRVALIVPTGNRDKATVKVRVKLSNVPERLFPDMTARIAFSQADGARQAAQPPVDVSLPTSANALSGDTP